MTQAPTQSTNNQQQQNFGGQQPYLGHPQGQAQPSYYQQSSAVTQPQYPMPTMEQWQNVQAQSYSKPQEPYNPNFVTSVTNYPMQTGYQTNREPAPYPDSPPPPYPGLPNQ